MKSTAFLCLLVWIQLGSGQHQSYHYSLTSTPAPSPYILYGPHGYKTYPHSTCQEVPTAEVSMAEIAGDWNLIEYHTSFDGKPIPPHTPYLCPEARMSFQPRGSMVNISQLSLEWPKVFKDVVEWQQHPRKSGVFFHEENVFALWTIKVMELKPREHMLLFFCIDYTIWPGWNHRGVYLLSRHPTLRSKVRRQLSSAAHRRMRIDYHRQVNTTICDLDHLPEVKEGHVRFHPHRSINPHLVSAPIHPYVSRKHRRNLDALD